jgi:hypothetical protein
MSKNRRCRPRANVKCFSRSMSEFKFACPVCGQHMMCDVSQSGSVMECPTCFQKITAPQAPASDDQKFILTGTKVGERPATIIPEGSSNSIPAAKGFSGALVIVIILIFVGVVVAFVYRGAKFSIPFLGPTHESYYPPGSTNLETSNPSPSSKPAVIAPPASGTNWTLNLGGMTNLPDAPVAGRIHALDFIGERAHFQNGILTLREGSHGPLDFGCTINFNGVAAEALSGQTINVTTNTDTAARITLRWKNDADSGRDNFTNGYAMRLEFGALTNSHLPGKIYLCTPDAEKSYLLGTFNADARKPKPKKVQQ